MPAIDKKRPQGEREPQGGWLGPRTHGWTDLREVDKPAQDRRPVRRS